MDSGCISDLESNSSNCDDSYVSGDSFDRDSDAGDSIRVPPKNINRLYSEVVSGVAALLFDGSKTPPEADDSCELVTGIKIGLINLLFENFQDGLRSERQKLIDYVVNLDEPEFARRYNCCYPPPHPEDRVPLYLRGRDLSEILQMRPEDYCLLGYKFQKKFKNEDLNKKRLS